MVTVFCPGSINVMGEHALVRGGWGIRLAVNRGITVHAEETKKTTLSIKSRLGTFHGTLDELEDNKNFRFIFEALRFYGIEKGITLEIKDDLPETIGLGSSAALTSAMCIALIDLRQRETEYALEHAREIVRQTQGGIGSGIDCAASLYGGMIGYHADTQTVLQLPVPPAVTVLYSGSKTPTAEAVRFVNEQNLPPEFFHDLDAITQNAIHQARRGHWQGFGQSMQAYQKGMEIMKLNTPALDNVLNDLRTSPDIYGTKIAGAGLGDSVIAIGTPEHIEAFTSHPSYVDVTPYLHKDIA